MSGMWLGIFGIDDALFAAIMATVTAGTSVVNTMKKPPEPGMGGTYRPSQYLPWNKQEPSQADELMNRPTPRPDIMSYLSKFIPRSY